MMTIAAAVSWAPAVVLTSSAIDRPLPSRALGFYDTTLRRVVLVGGDMELRARVRDGVWSWSGTRWEAVSDSGPPARGNAGVAFDDRARGRTVLYGGDPSKTDIWEWDGTPWAEIKPSR